jgi:class 3 adenylate cyclase
MIIQDHKNFWYKKSTRPQTEIDTLYTSQNNSDLDVTRRLASYVPKLLVRRLFNNKEAITVFQCTIILSNSGQLPETEAFSSSVLFADISGFTALTEKLAGMGLEGIERLTAELNQYFDKLIGIIYKHGGDIVKVTTPSAGILM